MSSVDSRMTSRRRRILLVSTDFPPSTGGIQEWTAHVAQQLSHRHDVTVVAPAQPGQRAYDGSLPYRIKRFPLRRLGPGKWLTLALATFWQALRHRPDVVLFCHVFAATVALPIVSRLGLPNVVAVYGMELNAGRIGGVMGRALGRSNRCIAISGHTAQLARAKGARPEALTLIGCGVASRFLERPSGPECLPSEIEQRHGPMIVTLARLDDRYKGHDMLVRAMPLILANVPDATYVIAGDGRHRAYYEHLARALGVERHVVFAGRVTDEERLALYDRCDVFAMISREVPDGGVEGFGIVFLEAAARGKPTVGGRSGGVPDAIADGETGILVEPTNVMAVADACIRLLTDHNLAVRMGAAGRRRVEERFTWERIADQIERVLLDVAGAGNRKV
jgi:phosphatidyl-myo-inositol dimannoside synthase